MGRLFDSITPSSLYASLELISFVILPNRGKAVIMGSHSVNHGVIDSSPGRGVMILFCPTVTIRGKAR